MQISKIVKTWLLSFIGAALFIIIFVVLEQIARELGYPDYALLYHNIGGFGFWSLVSLILIAVVYGFIQAILFIARWDGKFDDDENNS